MSTHLSEELNSELWGEKIRELRKEHDWSQKDLAKRLGIHKQTVSDFERGRNHFTLERLNRILDVLGYDATIDLSPSDVQTCANWGPIHATDPTVRSRIKFARRLAEDLAEVLYTKFDADAVYCFGSLIEEQGANFHETSDVDLLVEGLEASKLFEAQSKLELDVIEESDDYHDFSFDVIRNESFEKDTNKLVEDRDAVLIPEE